MQILRFAALRSECHVILRADFVVLRFTTVRENARSALECGGLTPPCSFQIHTDQRAKQGGSASQVPSINLGGKAASSRRTPRCLRHGHFHGSGGSAFLCAPRRDAPIAAQRPHRKAPLLFSGNAVASVVGLLLGCGQRRAVPLTRRGPSLLSQCCCGSGTIARGREWGR
jgi:hypothetical protein